MPPRPVAGVVVAQTSLFKITGTPNHSSRRLFQNALLQDVSIIVLIIAQVLHGFGPYIDVTYLIISVSLSVWDDSLDSSHEATSSLFRPVLKPVDDNIFFNNSSSYNNSVDSTSGRMAFKTRNAKEDTFDALFADVKLKPLVQRPKLVLSPAGYGGDPFSR